MIDHEYILSLIPSGKENAVSNAYLQEKLHLTRREVSEIISQVRKNGAIICSDLHGYYTPCNDDELTQGYDTLWRKAVGGLVPLKPMRKEIKEKGLITHTAEYQSRKRKSDEQKTENTRLSDQ